MSRKNPYLSDGVAKKSNAVGIILLGCFLACCCGGMATYGDYVGPKNELEAYQSAMKRRMALATIPGLLVVAFGIKRANDAKKKKSQVDQESSKD